MGPRDGGAAGDDRGAESGAACVSVPSTDARAAAARGIDGDRDVAKVLLNDELCHAAGCGALGRVKRCLSRGADPSGPRDVIESADRLFRNPLHQAAVALHVHVVRALVKSGAVCSPFLFLMLCKKACTLPERVLDKILPILQLLLDYGTDPSAEAAMSYETSAAGTFRRWGRMTPIRYVATEGRVDVLKLLLANGARVNGSEGALALIASMCPGFSLRHCRPRGESGFIACDHLGVARLLLQSGADPTRIVDHATPLCVARSRGDFCDFAKLFESDPRVQRALARRRCAN